MQLTEFAPGPALAPFVRAIVVLETRREVTRTLLPETGIVLGLRYRGFARESNGGPERPLPLATVAGMRGAPRHMHTSADGGMVLAIFRAGGAASFFAEPLHELFGATVPLDELVPRRDVEAAGERLDRVVRHEERVAIMEQFLLARLRPADGDELVASAVGAIRAARGSLRIGELARTLAISRDRLEKRFRRAVGTTPKQLASILRLRHAVALHRAGTSLTQLSLEAGYFDQSHFIREFRSFTGTAPREFFQAARYC